jgi:hypothetical protein
MDATIVRPDNFLRFTAPNVVGRVEIFVGAARESIKHEVLLRTQRSAKWRLKWFG